MKLSKAAIACSAGLIVYCQAVSMAVAENYFGLQLGGVLGARGTNLSAMEDLNYTGPMPNRHAATGSDIAFDPSPMVGIRFGRYLDSFPGFGVEVTGQYTKLKFKRQDVTITLQNTTLGGYSSFTEDQLPADIHVLSGSVNVMYRFSQLGWVKPYVGAGPTFHAFAIHGSGDSCHIVAPAALARGFCTTGDMVSKGTGIGFNVKAGVEVPINDRLSFDLEYKYDYARMRADWFRSFSDIILDYASSTVAAGVRLKF